MFQPVINDEQFKLNLHCPSFVPSCSSNLLSPPNLLQQTPPATAPPAKRQKLVVPPTPTVSPDLGTYIARDVELLKKLGWKKFVKSRRTRSDFANLSDLPHPAKRLLQHYKSHGAPVKFKTSAWTKSQIRAAIERGPHKSCHEHIDFLKEEFIDMINKEQWIILPYSVAKELPGLRLSPPGVVPQRGRRPRWIVDYSWWDVNKDTLPIAPTDAMQFGHALDRILREILLADPTMGPIYLLKLDISDGFYRINLAIEDIPRLGVVFPVAEGEEPLVAFPLVLPMGWTSSPPIFSAATETAADIANADIKKTLPVPTHPLGTLASTMDDPIEPPASTNAPLPSCHGTNATPSPNHQPSAATPRIKYKALHSKRAALRSKYTSVPEYRDPSLPYSAELAAYIDVFVDDFIGLSQGQDNRQRVRNILLRAVDQIFRPNDFHDNDFRREPVSLKKLKQGDVSWSTIKTVLGWVINTSTMTIHLPEHRVERLAEILASIPSTQKRLSITKWHKVLGELRSMSLALPGARNMFSIMQQALSSSKRTRIALTKGVHQALRDFTWMHKDIVSRPTRIAELIPLLASALGYHDASGEGAGGVWFPHASLNPRESPGAHPSHDPIIWRYRWPQDIIDSLVTERNPNGTITNSDLELAGGILHLDAIAQYFDVRERTVLSKTDNLATLFWQRKGSATTTNPPAYLLRLFGIHQRFHRYVPRHDYISGISNPMADDASRLFHLTDSQFLQYFHTTFPQHDSYRLVPLPSETLSCVTSALRRKMCPVESLLVVPPAPIPIGDNGTRSQLKWASTPFSKPSKTKYKSYKSSGDEFVLENLQQDMLQSSLDRLKITYGQLGRRSSNWVDQTRD